MALARRRVAHLAALGILRRFFEAAFEGVLIDLGAADLGAAAHYIDVGFFAAHQRANDFIDYAVIDQGLQAAGDLH